METVLAAPNGAGFGPTGVLYAPQTAEALAEAVRRFERAETALRPEALARWARTFTPERFIESFKAHAAAALAAKGLQTPWPRLGPTSHRADRHIPLMHGVEARGGARKSPRSIGSPRSPCSMWFHEVGPARHHEPPIVAQGDPTRRADAIAMHPWAASGVNPWAWMMSR